VIDGDPRPKRGDTRGATSAAGSAMIGTPLDSAVLHIQPSCPCHPPVLTDRGKCPNKAQSGHRRVSGLPLCHPSRLPGRTKISGCDPPLTTVRTSNSARPLLAFFDPPVELASR
jgi:hypothetical protein